ncbi:hypothetical protein [Pseudarthrobacter polychromogenes]|uniref:Helix-turn-helix domain-containing protein n=1 Tax=Pseudarthrobacter polychromogenes TaxID=1676 RepID=A0ABQ1X997_9MICC|nr:hypothetical protein [Pseudarthrobacter polychromogenes]GGG83896.1 hypothetical protein GCM10011577_01690 [Pseudarthrobacter polychromogenes]
MKKDKALKELAEAHTAAVEAETAAAAAQDRKREAVRAAFDAGCRGPEVAAVLGSSVQWAYKVRDKQPLQVA